MVAYEGSEPFVFVSYAHKDKCKVLPLVEGLQNRGFRVWYDEGIEVGMAWAKYVGERLEQSDCVLAYVTNNFDDSHNCWQELDFAMEEKKRIVAIKNEGERKLSAGMRMRLGSLQAMPFEKYGSVEKILETLSQAAVMQSCLGKAAVPAKPTQTIAEQRRQAASVERKKEIILSALSRAAEQKYGKGAAAPAKPAAPSAEKLVEQAETHYSKGEYEDAVRLYRKAAEQGYAPAQNSLGYCYDEGLGVPQNYEEAVKWYRKAADQGHAKAQCNLGECYFYGEGVNQNKEEAEKWYLKAAEHGAAEAQYSLGYCYQYGQGVRKNKAEARKWYQKAADQGFNLAIEALKKL